MRFEPSLLKPLNDHQRYVLDRSLGLSDGEPTSTRDLAKELGYSVGTMKRLQVQAMLKLSERCDAILDEEASA